MADNAAAANGKGGTIGGKVDMISSKFDPVYNLLIFITGTKRSNLDRNNSC